MGYVFSHSSTENRKRDSLNEPVAEEHTKSQVEREIKIHWTEGRRFLLQRFIFGTSYSFPHLKVVDEEEWICASCAGNAALWRRNQIL